ncbi:hypothetical protein LMG3458_02790 [Achromobacter deleyi]|uniref:Transmembrane protein n=1 Tax=Achromobacter deleyi TaxID=1353891 RepID=A0A6S6ZZZ3_9BURK|nr:hypothetical protein [Achromobacter deleyi]CAB3703520.1 hypothetical protein LMG3458_02790 [Achromobacter deleyi]CAB3857407.1 hypothetical protein LMG3482_02090 [Achromobacter deleyi]CAB3884839.1 hypothetical protein LMG3481_03450 [Achromobacter deleyi]
MHEEISYNHPALFSCRNTAPKIDDSQRFGLPIRHGSPHVMSQDLISAFPTRPVKLLRAGAAARTTSYVMAVFLAVIAAFFVWLNAPGIMQDLEIQKDPVVVPDASVRNAKCKVSKGFFYDCSANVAYRVDRQAYQRKIEISFISFKVGDLSVDVVRSAKRPELATFAIGLDKLWNRIAMLAGLVILMVASAGALLVTARKNSAVKAAEGKTWTFTPVVVPIKQERVVFGKTIVTFSCRVADKQKNFTSAFEKGETPFYLDPKETTALAIMIRERSIPILLDSALARAGLTDTERDELRAQAQGQSFSPAT